MTLLAILMIGVLVLAVLLVIPRVPPSPRRSSTDSGLSGIDADELHRAEEELSELDALATPEDAADAIPDWGPGVPKHRRKAPDSDG